MRETTIQKIRAFHRFYMPTFDLLGNHYLGSAYSVTEARVLFEVYHNNGCNASYIAKTMNIDKSYLSRIIKNHEKNGYLYRTMSKEDSRVYHIYLTENGKLLAEDFIQKSNRQIEALIQPLTQDECALLSDALCTVRTLLEKCSN